MNVNTQSTYSPIVATAGTEKEGSWVPSQGLATEHGFRNVSAPWYRKTISYEQGIEKIENERQERRDIRCDIGDVQVEAEGDGVYFVVNGQRLRPTPHAMRQFGTYCYVEHTPINKLLAPVMKPGKKGRVEVVRFYRDQADYDCLTQLLNNGKRRVDPKKRFLFRTYTDGTLRAMLTESYACVDNRWFIDQLRQIIPGGRLSHFDRSNADSLWGNVLIPDTIREDVDSEFGGAVGIGNDEIGMGRFTASPNIFKYICQNGCWWGVTKGERIHYVHKGKLNLLSLRQELERCITIQIPLVTGRINEFLKTREMGTDGVAAAPMFAQLAKQYHLTPAEATETISQFNLYERGDRNLYGMVNSLTRASQTLSSKRWVELDQLAGKLVTMDRNSWDKMKDKASRLDQKEVDSAFALVNA